MNTGTPMREKPSAMVVKVTVLPVPVAPATSPWRLPNFGCRKTLPWLAGSDVGVVTALPTRMGSIALPRLEMPGILANARGCRAPRHDATLDRKSTRLNSVTNAHLVCRLLLEQKT